MGIDPPATADTLSAHATRDNVIERVMTTYGLIHALDDSQRADARDRIGSYLAKLIEGGRTDAHELAVFGLAYLKELREGPNPRFTGW